MTRLWVQVIQPSLEDIQQGVIRGSQMMLEIFREITIWNQQRIMPWVMARQSKAQVSGANTPISARASASSRTSNVASRLSAANQALGGRGSALTNVGHTVTISASAAQPGDPTGGRS